MKRQRSYGDDLDDDDRRRFYDRAPQQPPPPPPRRRPVEYDGDGFDRRKGFAGGGFYDHRYRGSPSPRGYGGGGGDRAMHRSESFSGFRREFPKGFRSERDRPERDRPRRDGGGSSAWRRSGGGWKDGEDLDGHRVRARRSESSSVTPPPPPAAGERSDQSRRLESAKVEKSRKESCSMIEMEEGEVAPDPAPKREPVSAEPARRVNSERAKEKERQTSDRREANSEKEGDLGTEGKQENGASGADDSTGKEEAKISDAVMEEAGKVTDRPHEEPLPEVEEKGRREDEGKERDETAMVVDVLVESKREETAMAVDVLVESNSSGVAQEVPQAEVRPSGSPCSAQMKESEKETVIEEQEEETQAESVACQPVEGGLEMDHGEGKGAVDETEVGREEEAATEHDVEEKQGKGFDLEAEPEGANVLLQSAEEDVRESKCEGTALNLIAEKPNAEDKGKGIAFEVLSKEDNTEEDNTCNAGASGRCFDLAFQHDIDQGEASQCVGTSSAKQEDDALKLGRLDLSLSLPGSLQNSEFKCLAPKPDSPAHATSCQSLPSSSFRTNSDGFTASISFTNSQTLVHNPSCSLTQQPLDNYEHSVGSKPIFQGADQASTSTVWQAQLSNESNRKGGAAPLLQRILQNGHASHNTSVAVNGQHHGMSNDLQRRADSPSLLSPTQSHGSHDSRLEHSRVRRHLTRERSSSSLLRSERQEGEQLVLNGAGVIERVISKIVSEPLHLTGRMLQEMTEHSVTYLREAISEIIMGADKTGQIIALQAALHKRPDLNSEMLQRCPRVLLEILVAIKTGLPDFLKKNSSVATSDLVEIFLNLKCRNLACRSMLPVDDCDCKICQRKSGFCSSCMCIVCSKFDMASNTCSWVGCDVCLHWCHTDCGLRHSLIQKGGGSSRAYGTNEMQFHCAACGHPSEMFGFVKEVFRTCAKEWKVATLVRELQYVGRIFSRSDDVRGKRLRDFVNQMLVKLEDKANHSEVVNYVMAFLSDGDSNVDVTPSLPLRGTPCSIAEARNGIPSSSRETTWLPSVPLERDPFLGKAGVLSTMESKSMVRQIGEAELQLTEKKPVVDELDRLVRLKQAETKMYQERANDARREAESLKHIAMVKSARIEDDYATRMSKLCIGELEERRKQRLEELQVSERTHQQYFCMKMRMEANIKELLLKMEATKRNLST